VVRPDDPVEPDVAGLLRSGDEPAVSIAKLDERVRTTADELVQALVVQYYHHLVRILDG